MAKAWETKLTLSVHKWKFATSCSFGEKESLTPTRDIKIGKWTPTWFVKMKICSFGEKKLNSHAIYSKWKSIHKWWNLPQAVFWREKKCLTLLKLENWTSTWFVKMKKQHLQTMEDQACCEEKHWRNIESCLQMALLIKSLKTSLCVLIESQLCSEAIPW